MPFFLFPTTHDAQYFAEPILLAAKTVFLRTHEPTSPDISYDSTFVNFFLANELWLANYKVYAIGLSSGLVTLTIMFKEGDEDGLLKNYWFIWWKRRLLREHTCLYQLQIN